MREVVVYVQGEKGRVGLDEMNVVHIKGHGKN